MPQKFIVHGQKVSPEKIERAKELRQNMTKAEITLWQQLRANRLGSWRFRRQQILFGYIVEFYCHAASLAIEVDGDIHESQRVADQKRDVILESKGFKTLRFRNQMIENDLSNVLSTILAACQQTSTNYLNSPPLEGQGPGERFQGAQTCI